jgi:hypothetical protein
VKVRRKLDDQVIFFDTFVVNTFFPLSFVDLLLERFMPYCFLNIVLQDMDFYTRWINGAVESLISTRKRKVFSSTNAG